MSRVGLLVLLAFVAVVFCDAPGTTQQNLMVQLHNTIRANVNPPASPAIPAIGYDTSLETTASNYANGCVWGHNSNRGANVGENIAAYGGAVTDVSSLFTSASGDWESEKQYYTLNAATQTATCTDVCGHYTQQIWASTTKIGCGYKVCNTGSPFGSGWPTWTYVVCNYSPAGNYVGQNPYVAATSGTSATSSPSRAAASNSPSKSAAASPSSAVSPSKSAAASASASRAASPTASASTSRSAAASAPASATASASTSRSAAASTSPSSAISPSSSKSPSPVSRSATISAGASQSRTRSASPSKPPASPSSSASKSKAATPSASTSASRPASGTATRSASVSKPASASAAATKSASASACTAVCPAGYCGSYTSCGVTLTCGCSSGQACVGTTCQASAGNPNWSTDFSVTLGTTPVIQVPDIVLSVSAYGQHIIPFTRSAAVMDQYFSEARFSASAASGEFGVGFRHNQPSGANTMLALSVTGIGTANTQLHYMMWWGSSIYWEAWASYTQWNTAGSNDIVVTMTFDDASQNVYVTWEQNGWWYQLYSAASSFPNLGDMVFYTSTSSPSVPTITQLTFATRTTLSVSLYSCIDTATWTAMFYELTGADPNTVSVQVRPSGTNANCAKEAIRGVELVADSLTVVIESTAAASSVVAQSFIDFSATAEAGPLAISTVAVVPGTEGAVLAGARPLAPNAVSVGAGPAGGGGAGGGLSGGDIAGIVIGSVAGGVIASGVVLAVVAAVVVAAVVIAKKAGSSDDSGSVSEPAVQAAEDEPDRSTWRQTIANIFRAPRGGVNVMGNEPGSHQSITARAPPMAVA